jgi:hypothetical protein
MTVWTWVILLAVFIADATITVICRYVSGENGLKAMQPTRTKMQLEAIKVTAK